MSAAEYENEINQKINFYDIKFSYKQIRKISKLNFQMKYLNQKLFLGLIYFVVLSVQFCSRAVKGVSSAHRSYSGTKDLFGHYATAAKTQYGYYIIEFQENGVSVSERLSQSEFRSRFLDIGISVPVDNTNLRQLRLCCKGDKEYHWISNNCIEAQNRIRDYLHINRTKNIADWYFFALIVVNLSFIVFQRIKCLQNYKFWVINAVFYYLYNLF